MDKGTIVLIVGCACLVAITLAYLYHSHKEFEVYMQTMQNFYPGLQDDIKKYTPSQPVMGESNHARE